MCGIELHSKINLSNYTYFPGVVKHTDYTNSQVRTGWATEMDRKRRISTKIYYNPSYLLLASHGSEESDLRSTKSIFSASFSNLMKKKEEPDYESITAIRNRKAATNSENKKKNYFGSDQN